MSGMSAGGMSDAGTTARVFSTLLTWLQEKKNPVFVVATANKIDLLPPELLRKGRFDDVFFIDLPSAEERQEVLKIHIAKRNRNPELFDVQALANDTNGFSGAELEQVVISGLHKAFAQNRELSNDDLKASAQEMVPLAITMNEDIETTLTWAGRRTRPASSRKQT